MSLEDRGSEHQREVVDKYHNPNANYQMTTRDYVLRPSADGDSGAITITLPRVTEAKGRFYSIIVRNADGTNTVTIADKNDSECWLGDIVLNGKCDRSLLYSDGLAWHVMVEHGWPGFATTSPPGTSEVPTTEAPTTAAPAQTSAAPVTTAVPTTTLTTAVPTTEGG